MSLLSILGGIFGVKEKDRKKRYNPNFGGNILSISIDNRNFADISTEISEILFLGDR